MQDTYSGTWCSKKHPAAFSRGNVIVQLPHNIQFGALQDSEDKKQEKALVVEAQIEYLGLYRLRQKEKLKITLQGSQAVTENHVSQGYEKNPGGVGNLQFIVEKQLNNEILGRYILSHPEDHGTFQLKKGDKNINQCLIQ